MSSVALDICQGPSHSPSRRAWLQSLVTERSPKDSNQVNEPKVPRVPSEFRKIEENKDCYEPLVVSIGPYHHGKEKLEEMEKLKAKMAGQFVNYSIEAAEGMCNKVNELVSDARKCYAEESTRQFDDEKLTQMMFLDGCFILQVVFKKLENQKLRKDEVTSVTRDLFLLENQLPFQVLIPLMRIYTKSGHHSAVEHTSSSNQIFQSWSSERIDQEFLKTVEDFFKTVHEIPLHRESFWEKISILFTKLRRALILCFKSSRSKDTDDDYFDLVSYYHLLDFFYFKFAFGEGQHQRDRGSKREITSWNRYYSVNELKDVGISFVPNHTAVFVDVNFKNTILGGALRIPPLNIEDSTKSLLLNMAAYEACGGWQPKCTSYVCFMRSLIDKPEDVKVLRSKGILRTTIGPDDQIAKIFKDMTTNLVPDPSAYRKVKNSVESYHRDTVKRWILHYKDPFSKAVVKYSFIFGIAVSAFQAYLAQTQQIPDYGICSCSNATLLH